MSEDLKRGDLVTTKWTNISQRCVLFDKNIRTIRQATPKEVLVVIGQFRKFPNQVLWIEVLAHDTVCYVNNAYVVQV